MFCRISGGIPGGALMFSLKFGLKPVIFQADLQATPEVLPGVWGTCEEYCLNKSRQRKTLIVFGILQFSDLRI